MSCHSILLSSLLPNPRESQNDSICLSALVMTMHCAKLPKQAMRDVMMDHFQTKMLAVRHRRANVGQAR